MINNNEKLAKEMINGYREKLAKEMINRYRERILKNCNFDGVLDSRKSLIQRTESLQAKTKEYIKRRDDLLRKDSMLGVEIAALVGEGKPVDQLLKTRREIRIDLVDFAELIEQTEKALTILQADMEKVNGRLFQIVDVSVGENKLEIVAELDVDIANLENKAAAWHSACAQICRDYEIANSDRALGLASRLIRRLL